MRPVSVTLTVSTSPVIPETSIVDGYVLAGPDVPDPGIAMEAGFENVSAAQSTGKLGVGEGVGLGVGLGVGVGVGDGVGVGVGVGDGPPITWTVVARHSCSTPQLDVFQ